MRNDTLQRLADYLGELGYPAMVAGGAVVWYVDGWERHAARTWGAVLRFLGY